MAKSLATTQALSDAKLKLLESQLEPHMLFNTLANLRVLIALDPERAQAMLDHLIAFLRATLAGSRHSAHSLADEFARLQDYLELMKIRMGERLQTRLALPADLAAYQVPSLLLQPLVENAIKHGLEPNVDGGLIDVTASRQGDVLVIEVRDTGAGLSDPALRARPALNDGDATNPAAASHFGLVQVRERLANLYGKTAALTLETAVDHPDGDGGALATIRIPLAGMASAHGGTVGEYRSEELGPHELGVFR
jgi:sensor histidine kinase YesM